MFLFDNFYMNMDTWTINLLQDAFWKKNDCFDDTIADTECNPSIETIFIKDNVTGTTTPTDYVKADNFDWQSLLALLMWILAVLYSRCVMGLVQMNIFIFSDVNFMPNNYLLSQRLFIQNRTLYHKRAYQNIISDSFTNTV